ASADRYYLQCPEEQSAAAATPAPITSQRAALFALVAHVPPFAACCQASLSLSTAESCSPASRSCSAFEALSISQLEARTAVSLQFSTKVLSAGRSACGIATSAAGIGLLGVAGGMLTVIGCGTGSCFGSHAAICAGV